MEQHDTGAGTDSGGQTGLPRGAEDPTICYCYKITASQLRQKHRELGSLNAVLTETKAGSACFGCRGVIHAMFGETTDDLYDNNLNPSVGSPCVKPGEKTMTCFIVANGDLESRIFSCNATAPQLGYCDSSTPYEFAIFSPLGKNMLYRKGVVATGETFQFDTRSIDLPRPFHGMFVMRLGRENYGASRMNVQWGNECSVTSTHEISITGRPRIFLPVPVSARRVRTDNDIFLAVMNPWQKPVTFAIVVFDPETGQRLSWELALNPFNSLWINATEHLFQPALEKWPDGNFIVKVDSLERGHDDAVSVYFFFRNRHTNQWSSQHL